MLSLFSAPFLVCTIGLLSLARATCPYAQRASMGDNAPRQFSQGKDGVMLMNRIAPGTSRLYISDLDGSNEAPLLSEPVFEYHASFSPDGQWVLFTSERNGDGNSDIYRIRTNGSDLQPLVATPAIEDSVVLSPNGSLAAYVSTEGMVANIWVLDLASGTRWNLTDTPAVAATTNASLPHGYFRPVWSPDGQWIAFSSDRNTQWLGHGWDTFFGLSGWEHTQELSIFAIRPDGSGFRQVATKEGYALGSPSWSPNGKRVVFYEMSRETTWDAHSSFDLATANSTIVSVDFETGANRVVEVDGPGVKVFPQYLSDTEIGYLLKGGTSEGIYTTGGLYYNTSSAMARSPAWSPDGKKVVYEKTAWNVRPQGKLLYSWDSRWEYRFTDVFPTSSRQGNIAVTQKQLGDSSIISMNATGQSYENLFDPVARGILSQSVVDKGTGGAFQPSWSSDGNWITFGVGYWFQGRASNGGWIVRSKADGTNAQNLTESALTLTNTTLNTGFPSFSPDGNKIVFRVWGLDSENGNKSQLGLRILDLSSSSSTTQNGSHPVITTLTNAWDTLPSFSPDGSKIVFTRRTTPTNYDICTIRPDGSDLRVLTSSNANDAHAVWSQDGRIIYSTGEYGFQYECALYDNTFQPYGQINIMDADGRNKRALTNSLWEDSMPLYVGGEDL